MEQALRELTKTARKLENPFPYFAEAADAANKFYEAQRDYLMVSAELRARREGKRAAFLAAGLLFLSTALILSLFWVSMALHEAGMSSWLVALISFLVFGVLSGTSALIGFKVGRGPEKQDDRQDESEALS